MKSKKITETELYRMIDILLLDKNKEHLEVVKEEASKLANVEIDNSGLVRGIIEYYYENPKELKKVVNFMKKYKGYNILNDFREMLESNVSAEEIKERLGIGVDITQKIMKRMS